MSFSWHDWTVLIALAVCVGLALIARFYGFFDSIGQYRRAKHFLSPAELRFFRHLVQVVEPQFRVLCKVRLCDIVTPEHLGSQKEWHSSFRRISQKHVDFVLCDAQHITLLGVIELDDSSHKRDDRKSRDSFVDGVFQQVGLPIIHVPVKQLYTPAEIEQIILHLFPMKTVQATVNPKQYTGRGL